jgi:hypothetical protein
MRSGNPVLFLSMFAIIGIVGCATTPAVQKEVIVAQVVQPKINGPVKFNIAFSASGLGDKPSDAVRLDSDGTMSFATRRRQKDGTWKALTGMAIIEPEDYDSLRRALRDTSIFQATSADLNTNCADGELFTMSIGSTEIKHLIHFEFSSCSVDYNMLSTPARQEFLRLNDWIEYIRKKYRPARPQN